jgi:hypothetical protein
MSISKIVKKHPDAAVAEAGERRCAASDIAKIYHSRESGNPENCQ